MIHVVDSENLIFRVSQLSTGGFETVRQAAAGEMAFGRDDQGLMVVPGRAVSQVMVHGNTLDWSKPGVLEAAVPLLSGVKLYKDHWVSVDTVVGRVNEAFWVAPEAGMPGGIGVNLGVDDVADPRVGRLIQTGIIDSLSIGALAEVEPSHPDVYEEDRYLFWKRLGSQDAEGRYYCWVVKRVETFFEISLVWKGADPTAKIQLAAEETPYPTLEEFRGNLEQEKEPMNELKKLALALGLPETATEDEVLAAVRQSQEAATTARQSSVDAAAFRTRVALALGVTGSDAAIETRLAEVVGQAQYGSDRLAEDRDAVLSDARLALCNQGEELPDAIVEQVNRAAPAQVVELGKFYAARAAARFPEGGRSSVTDNSGGNAAQKRVPKTGHLH